MTNDPTMTAQDLFQSAERYLAQTETYAEVTLTGLSKFLGIKESCFYTRIPMSQWKQLRSTWIQSRIQKAIEDFCTADKTQDDFTVENIASFAGMPPSAVRRFLSENEWHARRAFLPTTQGRTVSQEQSDTDTHYIQQAERYLALNEEYKAVTIKRFAEFLGEPKSVVHRQVSMYQWDILRNTWIENRLRQAMEATYAEARTQNDLTVTNITRHAAMPYSAVRNLLSEDELRTFRATFQTTQEKPATTSQYFLLAEAYLERTEHLKDATLKGFAESLGMSRKAVTQWLTLIQWETLVNRWIEKHLREAMDAVYAEAKTQNDFTVASIARHAGMSDKTVRRHRPADKWRTLHGSLPTTSTLLLQAMDRIYAEAKAQEDFTMAKIALLAEIPDFVAFKQIGEEWRIRKATLPTTKEKVLAALQKLVDTDTPLNELTKGHVIELADVNGSGMWPWFNQPYQAALRQLAIRHHKQEINPPLGRNVRLIPGGWVDIDDSIWDLRPAGGHLLRRERLREDIAEVGWSLLQEELQSPEIALATVDNHYQGFLKAGLVLGDEVPNVCRATLEAVQRAWMNFNGTKGQRMYVRPCLALIFESLFRLGEQNDAIDGTEMFRISVWLRDEVTVGRIEPGEEFLSESELNSVIQACLADIMAGITYTDTKPNLLDVSLNPLSKENACVVVRWAAALMILIMAFTGLRRESVLRLKINDWAEVHPGLYILAWSHNKKVEENAAVLPAALAQQLRLYIQRTAQVRTALETDFTFLANNHQWHWVVMSIPHFRYRLQNFAKLHHLVREGIPLTLNNTVFRRTYATRALYEGRNLAALRSQLGHIHFASTLRYAKFDQYEHPSEVGAALDEYGRKALTLWLTPLILNELDSDKRASLLGTKVQRNQDVGLCLHNHCVKADRGSPPPCSLCEYLVTGPEFLVAWEMEHHRRKQELERIASEPGSEMMLAQMQYQLARFDANFTFIKGRFHT